MILPPSLLSYFEAVNAGNGPAAAALFSEDAKVHDEGEDHIGRAAIAAWVDATAGKYRFQVTPLEIRASEGHTIASCEVAGAFPGSPVTLEFDFIVSESQIIRLSIQ